MLNDISYVSGASTEPLLGETIGENLARTVALFPQSDALISVEQNYRATYSEFYSQTTELAKALLALGVQKGDRIGIWSPNRYEWVLLQYATARLGIILVNINPAYKSSELQFVINQSELSYLFGPKTYKSSDYEAMIQEVQAHCPSFKKAIFFRQRMAALPRSRKKNLRYRNPCGRKQFAVR